jgi:hypothetical protein
MIPTYQDPQHCCRVGIFLDDRLEFAVQEQSGGIA